MLKIKLNHNATGVFFTRKRILQFQNHNELISDEDILNLFLGLVRLIKKSTEIKIEEKYSRQIVNLKKEIKRLKEED